MFMGIYKEIKISNEGLIWQLSDPSYHTNSLWKQSANGEFLHIHKHAMSIYTFGNYTENNTDHPVKCTEAKFLSAWANI